MKFGDRNEAAIGLDIGSYSIKVTAVEKISGNNTLSAYNIKNTFLDAKNLTREQFVRETFDEIDLRPETVNLSISGPDVIVRFINLPKMSRDQLEGALTFEAEKYIPFNISEVILDFLILGDASEAGQMKVLLAAAKREPIREKAEMIERMGMTANLIDTDPFAMFNAFTESNSPIEDSGNVFLDLGHSQTNVLISIGVVPAFIRQIQIGGSDFTKALCDSMGITPEKAEELKMSSEEADIQKIMQATSSVFEDLIKEMQLSFGYFENRYNKSIGGVYSSGGMSCQSGVTGHLSEKLGIRVSNWDPLKNIEFSDNLSKQDIDLVAPQLAVSIGLALRG